MKTSFRYNDTDIYITVQLIDGRTGYSTIEQSEELTTLYTNTLVASRINSLEIWSDMVTPVLMSSIIYEDDQFELLMNSHGNINLMCKMSIRLASSKLENEIAPVDDVLFYHDFYVDSVEVINKQDEVVTYKIDLISTMFFQFMENRAVSTFNGDSVFESTSDVLAGIFQPPLSLNRDSDKTGEFIRVMSSANDKLIDTVGDILDFNMYKPDADLMLLPFDHMERRHDMWLKSTFEAGAKSGENTEIDKYRKVITINVESLSDYDVYGNNAFSISSKNYRGNKDVLDAIKQSTYHDFDFDTRSFSKKPWASNLISSSLGSTINVAGYNNRIKSDLSWFSDNPVFNSETSHWNEHDGPYFFEKAMTCLMENGTVLINTSGNIYRKPGIDMFVIVDSSTSDFSSILNLEGRWLLAKVRHIFKPKEESYTNNLLLSRLDIPDDASEFRKAT
jgi:hypothetical protein